MKAKNVFLLLAAAFFMCSCATLNVSEIKSTENKIAVNSLNLRMSLEVYDLRIDLQRETTTQTVGSANGVATTQTVNVPYHPLGVYLFDGVFLDINNNLSFNVIDLVDNTYQQDFEIKLKHKFRPNSSFDYMVTRKGNEVKREYRNFFGRGISTVLFLDSLIAIEYPGMTNNENIIVKDDRLRYFRKGLLGKHSKAEIVKTEKGFVVPRFGKDTEYNQADKNTITLGKYTIVKNHVNKVDFIYNGLFGSETVYTLLKLQDGYIFHDKKNRGIRIKVDGNKIIVEENGKLREYYEFDLKGN
jgi:hypothetical protein